MENNKLIYRELKKTQGLYPYFSNIKREEGNLILCSDCFHDEGLRLDAYKIGIHKDIKCQNCSSSNGRKLTRQIVRELCYRFFVRGTIERFDYGGFPLVQMNEERYNDTDIKVSKWLSEDVKLIEQAGEIGLFYYSPRFWMFGEIEPLKNLQSEVEVEKVLGRILKLYPKHILNQDHSFYRIRVNPDTPYNFPEYDTPPKGFGSGNRLNFDGEPIMYASPDLELCIHECRATVEDELYVAKLVPSQPLKMLNLAALVSEEGVDEFTSIDLAVHFLFLAPKHAYPICSRIAQFIKEQGFDGIIFPSYFSHSRTGAIPFETIYGMSIRRIPPMKKYAESQSVPNIALFGWPIKEGKVKIHSINKVIINNIKYDLSFGPAYHDGPIDKSRKDNFFEQQMNFELEKFMKVFRSDQDE
ncbi:RES family NAD+ phosphorylase [Echinicola marina]|uniref:RES family NAD+ phosphorylase n=1 Tax=Echinicola marina TaxID=2859768 RepID=UPI001CF615C8|nr:RES family NAD+ phosphorylase [Echinicola marina]UCS92442.1 RES family NAD+ phosphorylase [Echinicola marina]